MQDPTNRLGRWAVRIQGFDLDIVHRKGKLHGNVDALSRPVLNLEHEDDENNKHFDPWLNEHLIHYLRNGRHPQGSSKQSIKRI